MMKEEFETLAKMPVTQEIYNAIEVLYNNSSIPTKQEFVKSIIPVLKTLEQPKKQPVILTISISDNSGCYTTPNGCYYHLIDTELLDVDIKTGKITVREIENSYRLGYTYDKKDYEVTII